MQASQAQALPRVRTASPVTVHLNVFQEVRIYAKNMLSAAVVSLCGCSRIADPWNASTFTHKGQTFIFVLTLMSVYISALKHQVYSISSNPTLYHSAHDCNSLSLFSSSLCSGEVSGYLTTFPPPPTLCFLDLTAARGLSSVRLLICVSSPFPVFLSITAAVRSQSIPATWSQHETWKKRLW